MTTPASQNHYPGPSLLRLPPSLRLYIYRLLGLASHNGRPYTFYLNGTDSGKRMWFWNEEQPDFRGFHGLLGSCRSIYLEAAALLYSANEFVLRYEKPGSLQPLLALTPPVLSSLVSLKIVLRQTTCHHRAEEAGDYYFPLPLQLPWADNNVPSGPVQDLLAEWHVAARHLSLYITPGLLDLAFVCDIEPQHRDAIDLASRALAPLRRLPSLRDCHIRLSATPDTRLSQLAQDVVNQSRGLTLPYLEPPSGKTTFLNLPQELRLHILKYTDLVTPTKEVECEPSIGCFCRNRHAAISTTCTCWAPPGPDLFLVSRAWYQDAQLVFFSTNRFVVHDLDILMPSLAATVKRSPNDRRRLIYGSYPYKRFAVSHFLREAIPPHCIAHLRFLEIVFPLYLHCGWPQKDEPAMQDWRDTVAWLRDKINGPAFTIRLWVEEGYEPGGDRLIDLRHYRAEIHRAYMDLLEPLRQLSEGPNGISGFYASLPIALPMALPDFTPDRFALELETSMRKNKVLKESAERYVMGDRYNCLNLAGSHKPGNAGASHGSGVGQHNDIGDKVFDAAAKKSGHNISNSTAEKITDSARGVFEKTTG
ncbi:hypothetical protein VTH82DRAFT_8433 [Thermothelomyces myriococcoides]